MVLLAVLALISELTLSIGGNVQHAASFIVRRASKCRLYLGMMGELQMKRRVAKKIVVNVLMRLRATYRVATVRKALCLVEK